MTVGRDSAQGSIPTFAIGNFPVVSFFKFETQGIVRVESTLHSLVAIIPSGQKQQQVIDRAENTFSTVPSPVGATGSFSLSFYFPPEKNSS